jgi:hypothetical protein
MPQIFHPSFNTIARDTIFGTVFLGIKAFEYKEKFTHDLVPVKGMFHLDHVEDPNVNPANVQLFFGFYFGMTGIHALHMEIIMFFMHVKYSSHLTKLFAIAGFVWLVILFAFTLSDYKTRQWEPTRHNYPVEQAE